KPAGMDRRRAGSSLAPRFRFTERFLLQTLDNENALVKREGEKTGATGARGRLGFRRPAPAVSPCATRLPNDSTSPRAGARTTIGPDFPFTRLALTMSRV